ADWPGLTPVLFPSRLVPGIWFPRWIGRPALPAPTVAPELISAPTLSNSPLGNGHPQQIELFALPYSTGVLEPVLAPVLSRLALAIWHPRWIELPALPVQLSNQPVPTG